MVVFLTEEPAVGIQGLEEYASNLDIARGNFQIKMILNLASDIGNKTCEFSGDILVI